MSPAEISTDKTPREAIAEEFLECWDALEAVGWCDGIDKRAAQQIYHLAWSRCEQCRREKGLNNGS